MSLQAYQQVAQRAETPRETEYRLFGEITLALINSLDAPALDFKTRIEALDWNRRLWTTLANDCLSAENQLPVELRAQIVKLSRWVNKHTSAVARREGDPQLLIDVNRAIMQGLAPQAQAA